MLQRLCLTCRSPPYVAFLVCRIERENSSVAWDRDRRRLSSRFDLSDMGCDVLSSTSQFSFGATPYAVSAASRSDVKAKRSSVRSIMVFAAPTSRSPSITKLPVPRFFLAEQRVAYGSVYLTHQQRVLPLSGTVAAADCWL